jgi:hypothetical protein
MNSVVLPGNTPNGHITANPGAAVIDQNGVIWTKKTGVGNTGWEASDYQVQTSAQWSIDNPVLAEGVTGFESDTRKSKVGDGSSDWNSLPYNSGVNVEESVLDSTERLALNTSAGTYVEQQDNPNVIYFQTGADASDPDHWIAIPASKEADGSFIVNMTLADVSNTVPGLNELGQVLGTPVIGDAETTGGRRLQMELEKPTDSAYFVTQGGFSADFKTTTGYITIGWWDGTEETLGTGSAASTIAASKSGGLYMKKAWAFSSDGAGAPSGQITYINASHASIFDVGVYDLPLTYLDLQDSLIQYPNLSGLASTLTFLRLTRCDKLVRLQSLANFSALEIFQMQLSSSNDFKDGASLTLPENGALQNIRISRIENFGGGFFDMSNMPNLTRAWVSSCGLTSIRAVGRVFKDYYPSFDCAGNNLDAAALNQFFTDLAPMDGGYGILRVSGNPGSATCDPSIATAKGYTVYT